MIGRGIWTGLGIFVLLAALAYLTPLRAPVLRTAGETYPSLQHRVAVQRATLDTLQLLASNAPLSPASQNLFQKTQRELSGSLQLIDSWERAQAKISPFGFVTWCLDLFPWLAAFGLAFPILGGLIGAQAAPRAPRRASEPYPENPPSVPVTPARPHPHGAAPRAAAPTAPAAPAQARIPSPAPPERPAARSETPQASAPIAAPKPDFDRIGKPAFKESFSTNPAELARHPALEASRPSTSQPLSQPLPQPTASSPAAPATPPAPPTSATPQAAPPAQTEEWGFRHQPTPMESRRPKAPPVRSPHASHSQGDPGGDMPQAGA